MLYTKTFVCLANSRKRQGHCVAGKEIFKDFQFGNWVRPVSNRPDEEVSENERCYENGREPELLDIVTVLMQRPLPHAYQTENHLIQARHWRKPGSCWSKRGSLTWHRLDHAVENFSGALWVDGHSSHDGKNDRVPLVQAQALNSSLTFLETEDLVMVAVDDRMNLTRKVRARFSLGGTQYCLAVTDPSVECSFLAQHVGEHAVGLARLCISLSEPFLSHCYKLVAGITTP